MPTRRLFSTMLPIALAACSAVSPRPDDLDPDALPVRELTAAEQRALEPCVEQAMRELVLRHYLAAEQAATAGLRIDPRNARCHAVLGMVLLQQAKPKDPPDLDLANAGEARTVLAEKLAPADPFVGWVRALFLAESGHLSAAAAAADRAIARSRSAPPAERAPLYGLAGTYRYELGEERAALPLLEAYSDLRPDDAAAQFRIGSCLLRMADQPIGPQANQAEMAERDAEHAARAFARCVELAPGDDDAQLAVGAAVMKAADLAGDRGRDEVRKERIARAIDVFAKAAAQFPTNAEASFRVGVAEEARGDQAAAKVAYEAALARDGQHLGALLNLASLTAAGGDGDGAKELWRRALAADTARGGLTAAERQRLADAVK